MSRNLDWSKTGTICGYAEYLRKQSDAVLVLVIRPHDAALSIDSRCSVRDASELIMDSLPDLIVRAGQERKDAKAVRMNWDQVGG